MRKSLDEIKEELAAAARKFEAGDGSPELCRKLDSLKVAYEGLAAAEAGMAGQARTWQEILQEAGDQAKAETAAALQRSRELKAVSQQRESSKPDPRRMLSPEEVAARGGGRRDLERVVFGDNSPLTRDLDKLALQKDYERAFIGYQRRIELLKQFKLGDTPQVQAMMKRAQELRQQWAASHCLEVGDEPVNTSYREEVKPGEIEGMAADPNIKLVRMAESDEAATFSDPYWVYRMEGDKAVRGPRTWQAPSRVRRRSRCLVRGRTYPNRRAIQAAGALTGCRLGASPPGGVWSLAMWWSPSGSARWLARGSWKSWQASYRTPMPRWYWCARGRCCRETLHSWTYP